MIPAFSMRLRTSLIPLACLMLVLLSVQRVDLNPRLPIGGTRYSELISIAILACLVLRSSTRPRSGSSPAQFDRMHVLIAAFLLALLVSACMSVFLRNYTFIYAGVRSPERVQPFIASFSTIITWLLGISALYVVYSLTKEWKHLKRALRWWVIGAAICSAAALYGGFAYRFNLPLSILFPEYRDPNLIGRIYGLTQEPRQLAIFLSTVLPFLIVTTWRREFIMPRLFQVLCLLLVGVAFVMTLSRSTIVLILVISACLILFPLLGRLRGLRLRTYLGTLLIAGAAILLIVSAILSLFKLPRLDEIIQIQVGTLTADSANISNLIQTASFEVAWKMFLDHPLLGVGIGNFVFYIDRYMPAIPPDPQWNWLRNQPWFYVIYGTANNEYLELLAETGIVGAGIFILLQVYLARRSWRALRRPTGYQTVILGLLIGYVALLVAQAFSSIFTYAYNWALMGLLYSAVRLGDLTETGEGRDSQS